MPTMTVPYFACPSCGRKNVWKPAMAGKRAKCSCGQILSVPSFEPPMPVAQEQPTKRKAIASAPSVPTKAVKKSAFGENSAFADIPYRKGLQAEVPVAAFEMPPLIRDFVLPIGLIVAGFYATTADAMQAGGVHGAANLGVIIIPVMINIVVGLSLAVVAVLGGAIAAGIAFHGPIWQNILKICAVALLPLPAGSMIGRSIGGINGDITSSFVSIALYFAAFWAVFKMAWSERTVCVLGIWIIRSAVAYAMFKVMGELHGNSI